jgi:hypothetical protein
VNEDAKLQEARYFLRRMDEEIADPEIFRYHVSAFLSAARSVCQYACKEASASGSGAKWYQAYVTGNHLLSFFKTERDLNIHTRPVALGGNVDVYAADSARLSDQATATTFDAQGELTQTASSLPEDPDPVGEPPLHLVFRYEFADCHDPDEVPLLCRRYLATVEALVVEGRRLHFVSR